MAIDEYEFGRIRVDGREYRRDVIITLHATRADWRRRDGHSVCMDDLAELLRHPPAVLVIGTGYHGRMQVPAATLEALRARGIRTHVADTRDAVATFNRLEREAARVAAALHLTC